MHSLWDWAHQLKEPFFVTTLLASFIGVLYTAAAPAFGPSNTNGLVTQVVLKIVNGTGPKSAAAASGGEITSNHSYNIVQVGAEPFLSSSTNGDQDSLHAEIPLDSLGSLSYSYKYCYPNGSKLNTAAQQSTQTTSGSTTGNGCALKSWSPSGTDRQLLKYLLETIAKFIQLQHQINLLSIIKPSTAAAAPSGGGTQLPERCKTIDLQQSSANGQTSSQLASLFSPLTPKNCLISPSSATVTLTMQSSPQSPAAATAASQSASSPSISLEEVKKATLSGALTYQAFDYWGQKLSSNGQTGSSTSSCCQISHQNISFQLEGATNGSSGSTGTNSTCPNGSGTGGTPTSVKLAELWEKYLKRELKTEDWCKPASSKK